VQVHTTGTDFLFRIWCVLRCEECFDQRKVLEGTAMEFDILIASAAGSWKKLVR